MEKNNVSRKRVIFEKVNKNSDETKEALRIEKQNRQRTVETLKTLSTYFMFENIVHILHKAAERGLL